MRILFLFISSFFFSLCHAQTWTQLSTTGDAPGRANASLIYHPGENALYLFGGKTSDGFQNDLWKFDLSINLWSEVDVTGELPDIRHTPDAIFDEANNQMLIFSGQGNGLYNDVWSFDFDDSSWTERSPSMNQEGFPQQRYGTITVFDAAAQRLVTFGGFGNAGTSRQDDTWAFDLIADEWMEVMPVPHPFKRCLHNGSYVAGRELMVLYGGQSTGNREDIWTFDLTTNTWTERLPATKPPGRHFCSITAINEDLLYMFGGNGANQNNFSGGLNDLWQFSLVDDTWTQVLDTDTLPPARVGHSAVFLPTNNQLLIFGGNAVDGSFLGDVWVFEDLTTSVDEQSFAPQIKIDWQSSNPFSDHLDFSLTINQPFSLEIKLVNLEGKTMKDIGQETLSIGQHAFFTPTSSLAAGIYFLQITDQDGGVLKTVRLVKG